MEYTKEEYIKSLIKVWADYVTSYILSGTKNIIEMPIDITADDVYKELGDEVKERCFPIEQYIISNEFKNRITCMEGELFIR